MTDHLPPLDHQMTIDELIHCAICVPQEEVLPLIPKLAESLEKLTDMQDREFYLRHLIVLGALISRGVFEICDVPKNDRATVI